jgi:hypothetical protein
MHGRGEKSVQVQSCLLGYTEHHTYRRENLKSHKSVQGFGGKARRKETTWKTKA